MKIAVAVHGIPDRAGRSALSFVRAALLAGHSIPRVFFYHEAARTGHVFNVVPQDEEDLLPGWVSLKHEYDLELTVCIAAALRRGVLNESEAHRYERGAASLHPAFEVVGLGQLIDAIATSDRFVTFAA